MNLKEIQNFIKLVVKSGASEVKLEMEDVKLTIRTGETGRKETTIVHQASPIMSAQPLAVAQTEMAVPSAESNTQEEDDSKYITVKSPIIGTFYRRPSPDKDLFVSVGDTISIGDTVCIIEAMKLFNEIESEVSGKIVKVLVDDSTPVEFDQPLFLVDPS